MRDSSNVVSVLVGDATRAKTGGIEGALTSLGAVHEAGLVTRGGSGNLCGCGRGYWLVRCGCLLRRGGGCWLCRYRGVDGMNDRGGGGRNLKDGGRSTLLATLCICTFPDGHGENVKRAGSATRAAMAL